jgi:hypothetical protein
MAREQPERRKIRATARNCAIDERLKGEIANREPEVCDPQRAGFSSGMQFMS